MKIIRNGREKPWSARITCRACESVLEFEREDILVRSFGAMGDYSDEYCVKCPVCRRYQIVEDLPIHVKDFVDDKRRGQKGK